MKKQLSLLVLLVLLLVSGITCNAQLTPPNQIDTLIVKQMKYNKIVVDKENWPFDVIYRSSEMFIFGSQKFKIIDVNIKGGVFEGISFTLADMSSEYEDSYKLFYEDAKGNIGISFSGYDISCKKKIRYSEGEAVPFSDLEEKPSFQGGDATAFARWVNERLVYPEKAMELGFSGRVTLQFIVNTDGSVSDVSVLRGVEPSLNKEAVRVVSASPEWTPGKIDGKPVKVVYTFPVIFQLR